MNAVSRSSEQPSTHGLRAKNRKDCWVTQDQPSFFTTLDFIDDDFAYLEVYTETAVSEFFPENTESESRTIHSDVGRILGDLMGGGPNISSRTRKFRHAAPEILRSINYFSEGKKTQLLMLY